MFGSRLLCVTGILKFTRNASWNLGKVDQRPTIASSSNFSRRHSNTKWKQQQHLLNFFLVFLEIIWSAHTSLFVWNVLFIVPGRYKTFLVCHTSMWNSNFNDLHVRTEVVFHITVLLRKLCFGIVLQINLDEKRAWAHHLFEWLFDLAAWRNEDNSFEIESSRLWSYTFDICSA